VTSLRRTLVVSMLLAVVSVVLAGTFAVHRELAEELGELYDAELAREAGGALRAPAGLEPDFAKAHDDPGQDIIVTVWKDDGSAPLVLAGNSVASRLGVDLRRPQRVGYTTELLGDRDWRIYSIAGDRAWVSAAQPTAVRDQATGKIERRLRLLLAAMVTMIAALVWYLVGRGLFPLRRFAEEVARRSPGALQPVSAGGLPAEIAPVAIALNALLGRLERALAAQQTFVADAAHELLTPLTAVQVHLQMLERAHTEKRRHAARENLRHGLNRCIRLARQLLTLARQSPETPHPPFRAVDLAAVASDVVSEAQAAARARETDVGVAAGAPACACGDADSLRLLVRNLIDNAIKYTPPGGRVDLVTGTEEGIAWLTVSDSGPGIPEGDRERVFDRFFRRGGSDVDGSGLGLAIVREIAHRHGATVKLTSPGKLGGLDAEIRMEATSADELAVEHKKPATG
jgi:two-component system, OmpR family, sensor kinase